jgi:predicted RNA binding protein YcfA (HicA-like mRNA interferase family)
MTPRHRILKPREVAAILERMGFAAVRQKGSHVQYRHPDGRTTTVPFHAGRDISPILLRQIVQEIGITIETFYDYDNN